MERARFFLTLAMLFRHSSSAATSFVSAARISASWECIELEVYRSLISPLGQAERGQPQTGWL